MKKLLLACVLALGLPSIAHAQSDDVKLLMHQEEELNSICRGNSGDDPDTLKACDLRDSTLKKIEAKGWCWGPDDVAGYEKHWIKCPSKTVKKTNNIIPTMTDRGVNMGKWTANTQNKDEPVELMAIYFNKQANATIRINIKNNQLIFNVSISTFDGYPVDNRHDYSIIIEIGKYKISSSTGNSYFSIPIPKENTQEFLHYFTSSPYMKITLITNDFFPKSQKSLNFSLQGTTQAVNNFIKEVEENHISLPPPFKNFN